MSEDGTQDAESLHEIQEYEANELIIMMVLLVAALSLGRVLHRYHVRALTESGLFILVGFFFGLVVHVAVVNPELQEKAQRKFFFNHELFNLILLPHIIFEAGFSLPRDLFFTRIGAISVFAVGGTIIATLFTWGVIMIFSATEAVVGLSAVEAGALSALISAIDPVSTLTLFKLLQVHPELHNLLFGESVLNDAVSIILFRSIMRFFSIPFNPAIHLPSTFLAFVEVSAGSILMGFAVSFFAAFLLRVSRLGHSDDAAIVEAGIFWALSYTSFLLAEALELSGIVSALFCGIGMQRYAAPNLSRHARVAVPVVLEVLAVLAETTVFVLVGLAVWAYCNQPQVWKLIVVVMFCCFAGRALNIFGLSWLLNRRAKPQYQIPWSHQVVMWFSGLRGAIAVTLAVQVPGEHHDEIVMCTIVIVLFTTFVLGGLSEPLIRRMKIDMGPEVIHRFHEERRRAKQAAREAAQDGDLRLCDHGGPASAPADPATANAGSSGRMSPRVRWRRFLSDPRTPKSVVQAFSMLDTRVLKPLLVDASVEEHVRQHSERERAQGSEQRRSRRETHDPGHQAMAPGGASGEGVEWRENYAHGHQPAPPPRTASELRNRFGPDSDSEDSSEAGAQKGAHFEVLASMPDTRANRLRSDAYADDDDEDSAGVESGANGVELRGVHTAGDGGAVDGGSRNGGASGTHGAPGTPGNAPAPPTSANGLTRDAVQRV